MDMRINFFPWMHSRKSPGYLIACTRQMMTNIYITDFILDE